MLFRYSILNGKKKKQAIIYTQDEHKIDCSMIDKNAIKILRKLVAANYTAYLVGGAVRDLLIGKTPKDFDIVTDAEPRMIRKTFKNSRIIGKRFRLVHVFYDKTIFEVSTFRSIETGSIGNTFGTIEEDAHRRDFSVNALYFDPLNSLLIDFVNGLQDLRYKKLKPVIPLNALFFEDPVRMIRAIKYSVLANCSMGFFLKRKLKQSSYLLETVSHSRLTEEMNKILHSGNAEKIIENLILFDVYTYLQPNACVLLEEDTANFCEKYFASLKLLDSAVESGNANRQGTMLYYLIRDFLNLVFQNVGKQNSIFYYTQARHFILPLNPQREEFHYAVSMWLKNDYQKRKTQERLVDKKHIE
ncbi:MAG: polynucleotide adenylyltransferase PcnB [Spirochaetaceae bacterium]|nr:polynucleotide adenylyltransferase PcnB [Spirochaetaceae bacterium]